MIFMINILLKSILDMIIYVYLIWYILMYISYIFYIIMSLIFIYLSGIKFTMHVGYLCHFIV